MWEAALTRLDILVAVAVIASAVKSAYNGHLSMAYQNIKQLSSIAEQVDAIADRQEKMIEGVVALSIAENDEKRTVDTDRLADDLRDGSSYRIYLTRDGTDGRGGFVATEEEEEEVDEEEGRWRVRRDGG